MIITGDDAIWISAAGAFAIGVYFDSSACCHGWLREFQQHRRQMDDVGNRKSNSLGIFE